MKIGITLTSSLSIGQEYINLTRMVAEILAKNNFSIIYGGTDYGMMGELAEAYKAAGGKELIGIMSKELQGVTKNYKTYSKLDVAIWEDRIIERIGKINDLAEGFIILPGGYGTLEEMMSIVSGKANKLHNKPIVILDFNGFYKTFISFMDEMREKKFSKINVKELVHICESIDDVVDYFESYKEVPLPDKFV
jgi:uncharacterized protein (TIGR00730 family)